MTSHTVCLCADEDLVADRSSQTNKKSQSHFEFAQSLNKSKALCLFNSNFSFSKEDMQNQSGKLMTRGDENNQL